MDTNVNPVQTQVVEQTKKTSNKKFLVIALIVMFVLVLCASGIAIVAIISNRNAQQNVAMSCQYNGATYQNGTSFKSTVGCNTCTCSNGSVACTEMACGVNLGDNPTPTPTPSTPSSDTEETLIGKLQVGASDYFYGTTPYPDSIMGLKAADLVAMTCSDSYTTFASTTLKTNNGDSITDSTINAFVAAQASVRPVQAITWCKTDSGRYIVQYENCSSSCGGGVGKDFYFGELKNNVLVKETLIPNQLGAYPSCDTTLALSKNNELYVRCQGGEVPDTAAIYKVFLDQGNYTEMVRANF